MILCQSLEVLTQGVHLYGVSVQLLEAAEFAGELESDITAEASGPTHVATQRWTSPKITTASSTT